MREICTSGSVGAPGRQRPGATRPEGSGVSAEPARASEALSALFQPAPLDPAERRLAEHRLVNAARGRAGGGGTDERRPCDVADAARRDELVREVARAFAHPRVPERSDREAAKLVALARRARRLDERVAEIVAAVVAR